MFFGVETFTGSLYHFKLNQTRTGLLLSNGTIPSKVAYTNQQSQQMMFATGFTAVTDIQVGPDGYLYVLSLFPGERDYDRQMNGGMTGGTIFRIEPTNNVMVK